MSKAIVFEQPGPASNLKLVNMPEKKPGNNEILIKHTAIEVSFMDTIFRRGEYKLPTNINIPGISAVGIVEQVGSEVKEFSPGQRVGYANSPHGGGYSESNIVPKDVVFRIPDNIDDKVAAACLLKGLTAHYLCSRTYLPMQKKTVLIHSAAGGVGGLLAQLCRYYGANVIGTVGSEDKKNIALRNGCHQVVNYMTEDWVNKILEITNGKGVNCVYDSVGKDVFDGNLNILMNIGIYVSYGISSGMPNLSYAKLAEKSLFFTSPSIFHYKSARSELIVSAIELFTTLREGKIKPNIFKELPLEQAAQAHELLESRQTAGSIILIP